MNCSADVSEDWVISKEEVDTFNLILWVKIMEEELRCVTVRLSVTHLIQNISKYEESRKRNALGKFHFFHYVYAI